MLTCVFDCVNINIIMDVKNPSISVCVFLYLHVFMYVYIWRHLQNDKNDMMFITSPIPMPNTKRPMIITIKSGANAVTRAPTK